MESVNPYITFPGNCEEAFNFYRSIFGGEFSSLGRFSDIPSDEGVIIPEYKMNKIMYIALPIGNQTILMGSDRDQEDNNEVFVPGNNISLSITAKSQEEADNFFEHLSREGKILMQIGDIFSGSYAGSCVDKYGVNWTIVFDKKAYEAGEENIY